MLHQLRNVSSREMFVDANTVAVRDQERAGLDIIADPRMWYDELYIGWLSGAADRIKGLEWRANTSDWTDIAPMWNDIGEFEGEYIVTGKVSNGGLEWPRIYRLVSDQTKKPVKFGIIDPVALAALTRNEAYKDKQQLIMDLAIVYNQELRRLVDAGCRIIQLEEPFWSVKNSVQDPFHSKDEWPFLIEAFNKTVEGLSNKASIWGHFCWAGAAGQSVRYPFPKWDKLFPYVLDAKMDVINIEQASCGGADLELFKEYPTEREVAIGAVNHRMVRVETAQEVADLGERALKYVSADRLYLTSDCGLGRQSLPRFQAFHKIKALADGAAIMRKKTQR